MSRRSRFAVGVLLLGLLMLAFQPSLTAAPTDVVQPLPPSQPTAGPHGSDYPYPGEPIRSGVDGLGGYTTYEPLEVPTSAYPLPVVVLLRGACVGTCSMTADNNMMNAWRSHLVRKGNIVVFPHYQQNDEPDLERDRVASAVRAALAALGGRADANRFGIAGHSRGSQMTIKVASQWRELGIPQPRWLLVIEPGPTSDISADPLGSIDPATKLVVVVGEDDTLAGETKALDVWARTSQIPEENRDYIRVRSDRRGVWSALPQPADTPACDVTEQYTTIAIATCLTSANMAWTFVPRRNAARDTQSPPAAAGDLTADHYFPGGGSALDVWALWKISHALVTCSASGDDCDAALGDRRRQRHMGLWSDGIPVRTLCITDTPDESWADSCNVVATAPIGMGGNGAPIGKARFERSEDGRRLTISTTLVEHHERETYACLSGIPFESRAPADGCVRTTGPAIVLDVPDHLADTDVHVQLGLRLSSGELGFAGHRRGTPFYGDVVIG